MNNKILGIVGSALLILGLFLPVVSFAGIISFSAFDAITNAPINQSWGAIVLGLCGVVGLVLALTNRYRMLILPGVISLGILVLAFIKIKSELSGAATASGGADEELAQQMASSVSIGFGIYVMAIGAIIMIVAGIMKSAAPAITPGWGAPPPPYPPAR
ncbi:MAG TPA: hypothetical protein VEV81_15215 [Pyrinomonadaceae bacterium]|nr:hypothetical protein [Pyrinomonadaceae bacterium]